MRFPTARASSICCAWSTSQSASWWAFVAKKSIYGVESGDSPKNDGVSTLS
jgi:hypothetical protein